MEENSNKHQSLKPAFTIKKRLYYIRKRKKKSIKQKYCKPQKYAHDAGSQLYTS